MSVPQIPPRPPPSRSGCLAAVMVIVGGILLLPGLCALVFSFGFLADNPRELLTIDVSLPLLVCFGISALGIWLLRGARRGGG